MKNKNLLVFGILFSVIIFSMMFVFAQEEIDINFGEFTEDTEALEIYYEGGIGIALSEDQKEVIHLRFFHGLSFREISENMNISLRTVQSRQRLGMEKLKEHFKGISNG